MAHVSLSQASQTRPRPARVLFTPADLEHAADEARAKVAHDAAWTAAINRAVVNLPTTHYVYDVPAATVIIASTSAPGTCYYISTKEPMKCKCQGRTQGYRCYHIVIARLIVRAAEYHQAQEAPADQPPAAPRYCASCKGRLTTERGPRCRSCVAIEAEELFA